MSALWLAWRSRLIAIGAALVAMLAAVATIFRAGRNAERARQDRASLDNLRDRNLIDDEVSRRPLDDVRSDLNQWVRSDKRQRL